MSKVDAQRAMKEARYAAMMAQASTTRRGTPIRPEAAAPAPPTGSEPAPKRATARRAPSPGIETTGTPADPTAALCGHRSIGNKSCQRPAGHTEKNHRYK